MKFTGLLQNKKMMKKHKITFLLAALLISLASFSQPRIDSLRKDLETLSQTVDGLNEKVALSVTDIQLSDFIQAIANQHQLNVSVDDVLNEIVINNFYDARVLDVFVFLASKHNLDIQIIGNIISVKKIKEYVPPPKKYVRTPPDVQFNPTSQFLSMNLNADTLQYVAQEITDQTGENILLDPKIRNQRVNIYVKNRPVDNALEYLALSNDLELTYTEDSVYHLKPYENKDPKNNGRNNNRANRNNTSITLPQGVALNVENGIIDVTSTNGSIADIIKYISKEMGVQYFMYEEPQGNIDIQITNATYDQFLDKILNGTTFTYKTSDGVYLIGNRDLEGLRETELIELHYRTIETVIDYIPQNLKQNIEIKEFVELNGLLITGARVNINEIKRFLRQIDKPVPMVYIEMIIVDANKSHTVSTGIEMGLSKDPVQTGGTVFPNLDMTFSSESINGILNAINGFGFINLGAVTQDFYMNLSALEDNGNIDIRSTPKLSTLNGHEAKLSIGETQYYLEVNNQVLNNVGNQNILQSQNWKPLNADLSITIKPYVSGDEQVTLDVVLDQNSFTEQTSENAPRGNTTRSFQSLIRVKNNEMVLMGGLEKKEKSDSGSGVPILSRIPILKWFFSSRKKEKRKTKLNIFIKPTIIYY